MWPHNTPPLYSSSHTNSIITTYWNNEEFWKRKSKKKMCLVFSSGRIIMSLMFVCLFCLFFLYSSFFWSCCSPVDSLNNEATGKKYRLVIEVDSWNKNKKKERNEILFKSFVLYIPNCIVPLSFGPFYWINQQKRINIQLNLIREFYRGAPPLPAIYKSSVSDTTKLVDYWIFEFSFFFY
jgi:hypothetical protein